MASRTIATACTLLACVGTVPSAIAQQAPDFGTSDDVAFAQQLWQQLESARMAGDSAIQTHPYEGRPPHGEILELLEVQQQIGEAQGLVIVKKNFGGDASVQSVLREGGEALASVTVMFRREGFDPANQNWFWAKYDPDGSLQEGNGRKMAGKVAGCIGCHQDAPGNDYVYTYDPAR